MLEAKLMDAPTEGSLDSVSVPLLLAQAWRDEQSGLLLLAHGKNEPMRPAGNSAFESRCPFGAVKLPEQGIPFVEAAQLIELLHPALEP